MFRFVSVVLVLLLPTLASAAPGDLDAGFGTGGIFTGGFKTSDVIERSLTLDHLGRPILAATIAGDSGELQIALVRLPTTGGLDTRFNAAGPTPGVLVFGFGDATCADAVVRGKDDDRGRRGASIRRYIASGANTDYRL